MDKKYLFRLLKKQIEGELDEQELEDLGNYIKKAETDSTIYEFMDSFWKNQDQYKIEPFGKIQAEEVYQKIIGSSDFQKNKVRPNIFYRIGQSKIAASILIVALLIAGGYNFYNAKDKKQTIYVQYHAGVGKLLIKKLPDGSTVWLNARSDIKFEENFKGDNRDVFLTGEAYFDVAHNPDKPFVVHTGTVGTKVLGTAFDIDAYEKDKVKVTVTRGKVRVADGETQLVLLTKNNQLRYDFKTKSIEKLDVNTNLATSWTVGELVFDNVTLLEASKVISRQYNVEFVFNDPEIERTKFVISFKNSVKIDQLLDVLSKLNHFTYQIKDNKITINKTK